MEGISGVSMMRGMPPMTGMPKNDALSEEEKTELEKILEEYNAETLTEEDAQSIFDKFREAGIKPGQGMKTAVEEAGFDLGQFKPAGGRPQGPPPSPAGTGSSQSIDLESLQSLQTILNQFDLADMSAEDEESLISQFQQAGLMNPGDLFTIDA